MPTKKKNAKKSRSSCSIFFTQKKVGKMGNTFVFLCHSWWLAFCGAPWCVFFFFRTVQSPGITDGGRVTMLHVLRVGIARKFAGPQNDSMGGQAEKKVKQLMLQKSGGHQFIWLPSLKQTART